MSADRPSPWRWREELLAAITLPRTAEHLPLEQARGRVLAAEVRSPEQVPALAVAAMDGFAVRRADLATPGTTTLPVRSEIPARAGEVPPLRPGSAARIMTGAPVPAGADAVVEVEATDSDPFGPAPETVALDLESLPAPGRHVRQPGEEIALGGLLAEAGDRVGPGLTGLARTLGLGSVEVLRPLRVALVVTGDELTGDGPGSAGAGCTAEADGRVATDVPHGAPGAVRESNGAMLAAALAADGAHALATRRCGDDRDRLRMVLEQAAGEADLVLTTGGIGQGAFDVVKALLGERGSGSSRFAHLALRPGGPQGHGTLPDGVPVVHLPGTPVGALVGYHLFVRPLMVGGGAAPRRVRLGDGGMTGERRADGAVRVLPGRLHHDQDGQELVEIVPGSRLAPYGRADALVLFGADGAGLGGAERGAGLGGAERGATDDRRSVLIIPL